MKYRILQPFKSVTANGEQELQPGQEITMEDRETAFRLLSKGKIEPVGKVAYKVYSEVLKAFLWVVVDDKDRETIRASQGVSEAIYSYDEIKEPRKLSKEDIKEIHKVKETFPESSIKEVKRND